MISLKSLRTCTATTQREADVSSRSLTFDIYELFLREGLPIHRVGPILCDVFLDQPPLEHLVRHGGDAGMLRDLV